MLYNMVFYCRYFAAIKYFCNRIVLNGNNFQSLQHNFRIGLAFTLTRMSQIYICLLTT